MAVLGGEGIGRRVVMETEGTPSMGARCNQKETGKVTETHRQGQRQTRREKGRDRGDKQGD